MGGPPLACPVRGCGQVLERAGHTLRCVRRHSFDLARSGYVNLLQPQDRKAAEPGDARAAVAARAVLEARGIGDALIGAVARRLDGLPDEAVLVDLGCGTGHALATLIGSRPWTGVGIDLSVAAATHAARRHPALTWVVANADRVLPLLDRHVDVVWSLHGRRNPAEVARVLADGGRLIVAVPAADDLIELRTAVLGTGQARDRVPALVAEHSPWFDVVDRERVATRGAWDADVLAALLQATYRGARAAERPRVSGLGGMTVTLASDVCVFVPRRRPG